MRSNGGASPSFPPELKGLQMLFKLYCQELNENVDKCLRENDLLEIFSANIRKGFPI